MTVKAALIKCRCRLFFAITIEHTAYYIYSKLCSSKAKL